MPDDLTDELITYLQHARDLERIDLQLLGLGVTSARDERVREVYRCHQEETEEHLRLVQERLRAHGGDHAPAAPAASVGALEIGFAQQSPHTPTQLAISTYAFEGLEIAVYHLLGRLADRCGDLETRGVAGRILEEEERTAELMAGTFDRAVAATLALD